MTYGHLLAALFGALLGVGLTLAACGALDPAPPLPAAAIAPAAEPASPATAVVPAPPTESWVEIAGVRMALPEGTRATVTVDDSETVAGGTRTHRADGSARGAGLRGAGGDLAAAFEGVAPDLRLPGFAGAAGAAAGGGSFAGSVTLKIARGLNVFVLLGVVALLAAVGLRLGVRPATPLTSRLSVVLAGVGASALALGIFVASPAAPWIALVLVLAAAGAALYLVLAERRAAQRAAETERRAAAAERTARAVVPIVRGVKRAGEAGKPVRDAIEAEAGPEDPLVRAVVAEVLYPTPPSPAP